MARKKKTEEVVEEVKVEETPVVEEAQGEVLNEVVEAPTEVVEEEPKVEEVVETPAPKKSRKKKVVEEVVEETPEEVTADPANDSDVVVPAKKVVSAPIKVGSRVKIKKGVTSWYTGAVIDPISRDSAFYVKLLTNYNTAVISIAPGKGSYLVGEILISNLELC